MIEYIDIKKVINAYCNTIENCYNKDAFSNAHIEKENIRKGEAGIASPFQCVDGLNQ